MADTEKDVPTRKWRCWWRWCRIIVLLAVLALAGFLFYWSRTGLPPFVKSRILSELRQRGVELEFQSLDFYWDRGLVAEKVGLSKIESAPGITAAAETLELGLEPFQLLRGRLAPGSVRLKGGRLAWNLPATNSPAQPLIVERVDASLHLGGNGLWLLEKFQLDFQDVHINARGRIVNGLDWWRNMAGREAGAIKLDEQLAQKCADFVAKWKFAAGTAVKLKFNADALRLASAQANMELESPAVSSPYGHLRQVAGGGRIYFLSESNSALRVELKLEVAEFTNALASLDNVRADGLIALRANPDGAGVERLHLIADAAGFRSNKFSHIEATLHRMDSAEATNPKFNLNLKIGRLESAFGTFRGLATTSQLATVSISTLPSNGTFQVTCQSVESKWGVVENIMGDGAWSSGRTNIALSFDELNSTEVQFSDGWVGAELAACPTNASLGQFKIEVKGRDWRSTKIGRAGRGWFHFDGLVAGVAIPPELVHGIAQLEQVQIGQARIGQFQAELTSRPAPKSAPQLGDETWGWWKSIEQYPAEWAFSAKDIQMQGVSNVECSISGKWQPPELVMEKGRASAFDGQIAWSGRIDVVKRQIQIRTDAKLEWHQLAGLLPEQATNWLHQLKWEQPPQLTAEAELLWPAWTNMTPRLAELQPSLRFVLYCDGNRMSWKDMTASAVHFQLAHTNRVWELMDVRLEQGEGRIDGRATFDERTGRYDGEAGLRIYPASIAPLLSNTNTQRGLTWFKGTSPPDVRVKWSGSWGKPETLAAEGTAYATNFTWRDVQFERLETKFSYTNKILQFLQPEIFRPGGEYARADLVVADFNRRLVFLTNSEGMVAPMAVAQAIGPNVIKAIQPYQFLQPPKARVEGVIPMRGEKDADVRFEVSGGPFKWWRVNSSNITGIVIWQNHDVWLTNVAAEFYGGNLSGNARFNFTDNGGAGFGFNAVFSNVNFQPFISQVAVSSNRIEGRLSGSLAITQGYTDNWNGWEGAGRLRLADGLIWDIPVFGVVSPVLNKISPGLGNSRAKEGSMSFRITNSVVSFDDLEIRAHNFKLHYEGTVDFNMRLNARVEADVLRDAFIVGPVISYVFKPLTKLFVYKVTGTLSHPESQPLYIPKALLAPFQPVRTVKKLLFGTSEIPKENPKDK